MTPQDEQDQYEPNVIFLGGSANGWVTHVRKDLEHFQLGSGELYEKREFVIGRGERDPELCGDDEGGTFELCASIFVLKGLSDEQAEHLLTTANRRHLHEWRQQFRDNLRN